MHDQLQQRNNVRATNWNVFDRQFRKTAAFYSEDNLVGAKFPLKPAIKLQ